MIYTQRISQECVCVCGDDDELKEWWGWWRKISYLFLLTLFIICLGSVSSIPSEITVFSILCDKSFGPLWSSLDVGVEWALPNLTLHSTQSAVLEVPDWGSIDKIFCQLVIEQTLLCRLISEHRMSMQVRCYHIPTTEPSRAVCSRKRDNWQQNVYFR